MEEGETGPGDPRIWELELGSGREGRKGKEAAEFPPRAEQEELLGQVGLLSYPHDKGLLPATSPLIASLLPAPQQAWLLAELGFQSGEGLQEWGWACGMPEVIFSDLGHVPGYDLIASVPEVGCGLRNGADGNAHSC